MSANRLPDGYIHQLYTHPAWTDDTVWVHSAALPGDPDRRVTVTGKASGINGVGRGENILEAVGMAYERYQEALPEEEGFKLVSPSLLPLHKVDRTVVLMILENHTDALTGNIEANHIGDLANDLIGYCAQLREAAKEMNES